MQSAAERRFVSRSGTVRPEELPPVRSAGPRPVPDAEGLARAIQRYEQLLRGVARRILGDDDLAEDAVQEVMVSLWLAPEAPDALRGWLVRAVVHRSLHARRTRERRRRWEGEAGRLAAEDCPLCDPERQLDVRRELRSLDVAIGSLSEEFRTVLVLHEVDGLDYREIARRLAVPVGTVRSRLNRARRQLRARCVDAAASVAEGAA